MHLYGYNQLSYLLAGDESQRDEIVNYEGTSLQAIRYLKWKANFVVQHYGWAGPKDELNAPLLFNLRRVLYENAAEESDMYAN